MTTADMNTQTIDHEPNEGGGRRYSSNKKCTKNDVWSLPNIAIMVLGFIFFFPLGLIVLFGMICGVGPLSLPGKMMSWFHGAKAEMEGWQSTASYGAMRRGSGNGVFDEYQQTQLDRIDEIRAEVRDRDSKFRDFKDDETRKEEQTQFDRFMNR